MAAYLAEHPELADCTVRANTVSILVVSNSRTIILHHINALGACEPDVRPQAREWPRLRAERKPRTPGRHSGTSRKRR